MYINAAMIIENLVFDTTLLFVPIRFIHRYRKSCMISVLANIMKISGSKSFHIKPL